MSGEKTEKPTPRRRKENRKKGTVARTPEFGAWIAVLALGLALPKLLSRELTSLRELLVACLTATSTPTIDRATTLLGEGLMHVAYTLVILGSGVMLIGVAAAVAQGGFLVATQAVKPQFSRLNPIKGFTRMFGPHALWEGAKMLLKSALVAALVWSAIKATMPLVGGLVPIPMVLDLVTQRALGLIRNVAGAGLVMATADYAMARRRTGKQTKMSKEEIKQESRQTEGDPMVKSAIRSRQLAAARNRMMQSIPQADVVLVNPTHVAVALQYDAARGAPRVVARGAGAIAAKIREAAGEAGVPLVQDVPLARALYSSTRVGQEIPPELFAAVAQVLAFVISRRTRGQRGGEHRTPRVDADLPAVTPAGRRRISSGPPPKDR